MTNADKALAILHATQDGHLLYAPYAQEPGDGWQLRLVEAAVNGHLTKEGQTIFDVLYVQVVEKKDWLYGSDKFARLFLPKRQMR